MMSVRGIMRTEAIDFGRAAFAPAALRVGGSSNADDERGDGGESTGNAGDEDFERHAEPASTIAIGSAIQRIMIVYFFSLPTMYVPGSPSNIPGVVAFHGYTRTIPCPFGNTPASTIVSPPALPS